MANLIKAIRGMNDILPPQTDYWAYLEDILRQVATSYSYAEIRFPILEKTHLFKRTIGAVTDIVEKEMYTFEDRKGESLSMRPEGTAGCVRAGIQQGLFHNQQQRLWYLGPMFRYERPQLGRFRQFFHFGIEAFGMKGPDIDMEQILMVCRIWEMLGLKEQISLQINSLGSTTSRERYREKLIEYFNENIEVLDEDSLRRLQLNPLRILDSKNPDMQLMLSGAPRILDYLDEASQQHFDKFRRFLDLAKISYEINPRIVRGIDYYNMTVYEWVTDQLGAQGTVCAGGRYDNLVKHLGGQPTPAVGCAIGLERVVTLLETVFTPDSYPHVYTIILGNEAISYAMLLSEHLHDLFPEIRIMNDYSGGNLKNQMRRADKSGAKLALIIGDHEVKDSVVSLKYLREDRPQITLNQQALGSHILHAIAE